LRHFDIIDQGVGTKSGGFALAAGEANLDFLPTPLVVAQTSLLRW
jgi:hypothetical protein